MTATTGVSVLNDVTIVDLDFTIWTGIMKMQPTDYCGIKQRDLPPEEAASLGSKRVVNPDTLRPLAAYRGKAERECSAVGVRFLSGWAVPNNEIKSLSEKLRQLCHDFDADLNTFLSSYDTDVDDWIKEVSKKSADFARQIDLSRLSDAEVRQRFGYRLSIFQVSGSPFDLADTMSNSTSDLRSAVVKAVFDEIYDLAEKARMPTETIFKKTVRTRLRRTADRLRRFDFCDTTGAFIGFANALENAAQGEGTIRDDEFRHITAMLRQIVDVASLEAVMGSNLPVKQSGSVLNLASPDAARVQPELGSTEVSHSTVSSETTPATSTTDSTPATQEHEMVEPEVAKNPAVVETKSEIATKAIKTPRQNDSSEDIVDAAKPASTFINHHAINGTRPSISSMDW